MLHHQYCKLFACIKSVPQTQLVCFHNISEKQFFISLQFKVDDTKKGYFCIQNFGLLQPQEKTPLRGSLRTLGKILAEIGGNEIGKR